MEQQINENISQMKERADFFIKFYQENYTRVFNFVYRTLAQREAMTTEDITQNTFYEAWKKVDILLTHPNQTGWLMETAKKKAWSQLKKSSSKEISYEESMEESYVESAYNALELQMIIDKALTDDERELFRQYFVEKNSVKMMAQQEHMSEVAFKVKMHRIRKKVQNRFKE